MVLLLYVIFCDLGHDFIETIGPNRFDSFLLIDFIDWHALVLQCKEEEHELVDLLLHVLLLLLLFPQLEAHMLFLFHQDKFVLGQCIIAAAELIGALVTCRL